MTEKSYVVARFVIRKDGLPMIGKVLRSDLLKPDRIYQIEEWLGELVIRDLGPSIITDKTPVEDGAPHWGYDFNWIFKHCKEFILTRKEWKDMQSAVLAKMNIKTPDE